jgi:hypothetical protein
MKEKTMFYLRWTPGAVFTWLILLGSIFYAIAAWSPSSYGIALHQMGAPADQGPLVGVSREIRSDEWAVWTPYVQIAVNNGFERYDANSPYNEDLRNFNALPLKDWALVFKPQYWAFFLLDPAHAFSIYHVFFMALCLLGYHRLVRKLGIGDGLAACLSLTLFFSGFVQFTWTTMGPSIAAFPWFVLCFLSRDGPLENPWIRAGALYYLGTFWLLSYFYPPIILSLGFAAVVLVSALRRDVLSVRSLALAAVAAGAAAATAYLYLAEPLQVMTSTIYPGQRHSDGGSGDPWIWLSTVLPHIVTRNFDSLIVHNLVETGAVGSYWPLLLLTFTDWRAGLRPGPFGLGWAVAVLAAGLGLMSAWMLLPIPSAVGGVLLWDRVFPPRMIMAIGLLVLVLAAVLTERVSWRVSPLRLAVFAATIVAAWCASKLTHGIRPWSGLFDVMILLTLPAGLALHSLVPRLRLETALAGAAVAANVLVFGQFNPIQSAKPIFDRPRTAVTQEFDRLAAAHEKGWLVETLPVFTGSVLAGWGYRSIAHTLIAPQLAFFRPLFPDMPEDRFIEVFNRYAHIIPQDVPEPFSPYPDQILLPRRAFVKETADRLVDVLPVMPAVAIVDGSLDEVRRDGKLIRLRGWAPWRGVTTRQRIVVVSRSPLATVSYATEPRPDLVAAFPDAGRRFAGFRIVLRLADDGEPALDALCVLAEGTDSGTILLRGSPNEGSCLGRPHAAPHPDPGVAPGGG